MSLGALGPHGGPRAGLEEGRTASCLGRELEQGARAIKSVLLRLGELVATSTVLQVVLCVVSETGYPGRGSARRK